MVLEEEVVYGRCIRLSFWNEKSEEWKFARRFAPRPFYEVVFIHFEVLFLIFFFLVSDSALKNPRRERLRKRSYTLFQNGAGRLHTSARQQKKKDVRALRFPIGFTLRFLSEALTMKNDRKYFSLMLPKPPHACSSTQKGMNSDSYVVRKTCLRLCLALS